MGWVEELGSGRKNIKKYAPLYYSDYKVEIQNQEKFVFTISYSKMDADLTPDLTLLAFCIEARDRAAMMKQIVLKNIQKNADRYIRPLIEKGYLKMTIPEKPNSRLQKYVITVLGRKQIK